MADRVLTLTELARQITECLELRFPPLWVTGELSGYKQHPSGHHYFTLKDSQVQFSAVLWRSRAQRLDFPPRDGLRVEALVQPVFYGPGGRLQLDVQSMRPAGAGDLMRQFLERKERLQAEGLFETARKRPLPAWPCHIGLLTARHGAALQDMLKVLRRRRPGLCLTLRPTPVQGPEAGQALADNLRLLQQVPGLDLIILGRGGGSFEDLDCFNSGALVRAIAACPVPVISAVGHEVDFTLSDMVADLRAPTPSAAAELAVPESAALARELEQRLGRLGRAVRHFLRSRRQRLDALLDHKALDLPRQRITEARRRMDSARERAGEILDRRLAAAADRLPGLERRLRQVLRARADRTRERLLGLAPRLRAGLALRQQHWQASPEAARRALDRALGQQLERRRERLAGLGERLARLESGRLREWALRLGFAELRGPDGRWYRRLEHLPAAGSVELVMHDGSRTARLPAPDESQGEPR